MKGDSRTFISPHGTLIVGKDGVKIKRTWSQALQNGRLTPREQDIPFSSLETVKRQRGRNDAEYIQLISRHGAPKVTPLNRKTQLKYGGKHSFAFRQAERMIKDRLKELQDVHGSPTTDVAGGQAQSDGASASQPKFPGLRFRK